MGCVEGSVDVGVVWEIEWDPIDMGCGWNGLGKAEVNACDVVEGIGYEAGMCGMHIA